MKFLPLQSGAVLPSGRTCDEIPPVASTRPGIWHGGRCCTTHRHCLRCSTSGGVLMQCLPLHRAKAHALCILLTCSAAHAAADQPFAEIPHRQTSWVQTLLLAAPSQGKGSMPHCTPP